MEARGASRASKTLILMRHGDAAGYEGPDAPLTNRGRMQSRGAYAELERYGLAGAVQAVVCSPLSRSLTTVQAMFEGHGTLRDPAAPAAAGHTPVYVTALARERLTSRGDVGREPAELLADPALALDAACFGRGLSRLPPRWWLGDGAPGVGGEAAASLLLPAESREAFRARIAALRALLWSLPHSTLLLVGHAVTLAALDGRAAGLRHCQIRTVTLGAGAAADGAVGGGET